MFIKQDELRIDVGFDGKLVQQARAKSVDGGDYRTFERALVPQPSATLIAFSGAQKLVNSRANTLAHLIRCAIREGDSNDVINRDVLGAENLEVALNQDGRLTRSRSGSNREMSVESVGGNGLFGL
jgi:hypothetical protein